MIEIRMPTLLTEAEGEIKQCVLASMVLNPAQSQNLSMCENSLHGNREIPASPAVESTVGRSRKAKGRTLDMHDAGKSDGCEVPKNSPNNVGFPPTAEAREGRRPTKGNAEMATESRTQSRINALIARLRVREVARRDRRARFTALLHHVTTELLEDSFYALKRGASPGVDGVTWRQYEEHLEDQIVDLHRRIHNGTYRAQPSRRVYIPKADGRERPLGIAALEDKIVQQAVVTVLNMIYEEDFLGFSYGFRPQRGAHDALDALWICLMDRKVNWVLDADIQGFFDTINHEWLLKILEHRIADRRILRLIQKWLQAGVSEDGRWLKTTVGTPQGAVISPLLANVFLHYVFDLWVNQWRKQYATGDIYVVRYADDFVLGFQHRHEAERFLRVLRERFAKFGLHLHPEKTRLIEFGRFAVENRSKRGQRKPETFDFLGFTHYCGCGYRAGRYYVRRKTVKKRFRVTLQGIKQQLRRRQHASIPDQAVWLRSVVQGYYQYYAIPGNGVVLRAMRREVLRHWLHLLRRRGQRNRITWKQLGPLADRWIPSPKILHPHPNERFYAKYPK
jgi:group II intron reverse transcriptase/maturase